MFQMQRALKGTIAANQIVSVCRESGGKKLALVEGQTFIFRESMRYFNSRDSLQSRFRLCHNKIVS